MQTKFLLASILLATLPGSTSEALRFGPPAGAKLKKTFVQKVTSALTQVSIVVDGEEVEVDMEASPSIALEREETIAVIDEYVQLAAGRPEKLVRQFEKIHSTSSEKIEFGEEETSQESEQGSDLEGRSVRFTWNEESGEYDVAFASEEGDESLLAGLDEDMDLRDWLPEKEEREGLAEGASWEVPLDAFRYHLFAGGLDLVDLDAQADAEADEDEDKRWKDYLENASGEIRAKWVRSEGGLATIDVDINFESWIAYEPSEEGVSSRVAFQYDLKGELIWNLEAGRVERFEVAGESIESVSFEGASEDGPSVGRTMEYTSAVSFTVETEALD